MAYFNELHSVEGNAAGGAQGVYFTAYGIAVKHGFQGTEEEWLASLVGPSGESGTIDTHTASTLNGILSANGTAVGARPIDDMPTASSAGVVLSGGIKTALDAKQNSLTFDTAPRAGSGNPVTSDGVKAGLDAKQNTLTFDTEPTVGSNNPVTSGGIKAALNTVASQISAAVGSPLTASSAEAMTDNTKIYVYVGSTTSSLTNGHWYYWNGSAWADGGAYNASAVTTDTTLAVSGMAADAKSAGDAIGWEAAIFDVQTVTPGITTGYYINAVSIGGDWTDSLQSSSNYNYLTSGIDTSGYNDGSGYIIISNAATFPSNSCRLGFSDSSNTVSFVTSHSQANGYAHQNTAGQYELVIPVLGDKFFYSNHKNHLSTNPENTTFKLCRSKYAPSSLFKYDTPSTSRYVATDGSDDNPGTEDQPYATIAYALRNGATTVFLKPGTYTQSLKISGWHGEETGVMYGIPKVELIGLGTGAVFDTFVGTPMKFEDCDVHLDNITVQNVTGDTGSGMHFIRCTGHVENCKTDYTKYMGFRITGSKMTFVRCVADHVTRYDGFNGHDTPEPEYTYHNDCTFIDCKALHCADDGLSFHEYGHMTVIGGEFAGNANTGIAPHQWCTAEIRNAYIRNNGTNGSSGIECKNPSYVSGDKGRVMTFGNLIAGNSGYAIQAVNYNVISLGDKFINNTAGTTDAGTGATITVY